MFASSRFIRYASVVFSLFLLSSIHIRGASANTVTSIQNGVAYVEVSNGTDIQPSIDFLSDHVSTTPGISAGVVDLLNSTTVVDTIESKDDVILNIRSGVTLKLTSIQMLPRVINLTDTTNSGVTGGGTLDVNGNAQYGIYGEAPQNPLIGNPSGALSDPLKFVGWQTAIGIFSKATLAPSNIQVKNVDLRSPAPSDVGLPFVISNRPSLNGPWVSGATLSDITIDGADSSTGIGGEWSATNQYTADQLTLQGVYNATIDNLFTTNGGENGLAVAVGSNNVSITNSSATFNDGHGFNIGSGTYAIDVADDSGFTLGMNIQGQSSGAVANVLYLAPGRLWIKDAENAQFIVGEVITPLNGNSTPTTSITAQYRTNNINLTNVLGEDNGQNYGQHTSPNGNPLAFADFYFQQVDNGYVSGDAKSAAAVFSQTGEAYGIFVTASTVELGAMTYYDYGSGQIPLGVFGGSTATNPQNEDSVINFVNSGGTVVGTESDDFFNTSGNSDNVQGMEGNDTADGGGGNDTLDGGPGIDTLSGGAGSDTIFGGDDDDTLSGDGGADDIAGGAGDDTIDGGVGGDELDGNDGADVISGGDGNDFISGGAGNDVLAGQAHGDNINGNDGDDTVDGGDGSDTLTGGPGNDSVIGGAGDDTLEGNDGDDNIVGGLGNDMISAGNGDDTVLGGDGLDTINGNSGADRIEGGESTDMLFGDDGNDTLFGDGGNDTMNGGAGRDVLRGGDGNDIMNGDAGIDTLIGNAGDDSILGGSDNDRLFGNDGDDELDGQGGNDFILAGTGGDTVRGGDGNDRLIGSGGIDVIEGNAGNDTILGGADSDILSGNDGDDILSGQTHADVLDGGAGNDRLTGGDGDDILNGNSGNDTFFGSSGDDTLSGGEGNDDLNGGPGNDTLRGNGGDDKFNGFSGNDTLFGNSGDDAIRGGTGDDTISGSLGSDRIIFDSGWGNDTLTDFQGIGFPNSTLGTDVIDMRNVEGVSGYDDLTITTGPSGNDILIVFGNDSILISNFYLLSWLGPNDFLF